MLEVLRAAARTPPGVLALAPVRRLRSEMAMRRANALWGCPDAELLVIRHPRHSGLHQGLLAWLEANFPAVRRRFELRLMPLLNLRIGIASSRFRPAHRRLVIPWLQDPVPAWSPMAHRGALALDRQLRGHGLPCVNSPANLLNAAKAATALLVRVTGVRTPRTKYLRRSEDLPKFQREIGGPVLVRSDWAHGESPSMLQPEQHISWRKIRSMKEPIAVEFIDTSDAEGVFWKYRYLAAGSHGISVHRLGSSNWEVRGSNKLVSPSALAREAAFINRPSPYHAELQAVRHALGLEIAAFDYSLDREGNLILWEANPSPGIWFGSTAPDMLFREEAVHRSYAAMTSAYLEYADLPVPMEIERLCSYTPESRLILPRLCRN